MNIWERIDRDHVVIHASGRDIMNSRGDLPRRHNQFAVYRHEVLRHLDVIDEVVLPLLDDERARGLRTEHKSLRTEIRKLDRRDKTGEWNEDFSLFAQRFETACKRHDGLEHIAQGLVDDARADELGEEYEQAKIRLSNGRDTGWRTVSLGLGAAIGAVALGAAAAGAIGRKTVAGSRPALPLQTDETVRLISSKKVEGTPVVSPRGEKLGRIESFMVDKYSGRVAYAVLSFGGQLGFGRSLFPLPWELLDYDEALGGYALAITRAELDQAPRFTASEEPDFDAAYRRRIILFYQSDADAQAARSEPETPVEPALEPQPV